MIERGDPTKAVDILCCLASKMDIDVVERKVLARLAGDRTGCKERVAEVALKEALAIDREARAQAVRDKASRESTRVRLPALPADTEINPVMETWDEILANTPAAREEGQEFAEPPMRDAEGWPIEYPLARFPWTAYPFQRRRKCGGGRKIAPAGAGAVPSLQA